MVLLLLTKVPIIFAKTTEDACGSVAISNQALSDWLNQEGSIPIGF